MLKLAVIGKDVSQSLSPRIHQYILGRWGERCSYEKISLSPEAFVSRAESLFSEFDAFNVTIPFKEEIIPFLSGLMGDAVSFGAVNTVVCKTRTGYNTDGYGFLLMLENEGVSLAGKTALVLGAGGAGRSCVKKLIDAGAAVSVYERNAERLNGVYREFGGFTPLNEIPCCGFDVVVNCTGVGMHGTVGISPADANLLAKCGTAVDLIYVPAESEFLRLAREAGKKTVNGAAMLFYQAYRSDCIYTDRTPSAEEAKAFWNGFREELK